MFYIYFNKAPCTAALKKFREDILIMFVYSLKASTLKFVAVVIVSIGLLITLVAVIPTGSESLRVSANAAPAINFKEIATAEDRAEFLTQYGWEINPEAVEVVDVVIPKEFNAVYTKYNDVQKQQKLDLSKYKNKTVKRYTYEVTNYPDYEGRVLVSVLIYKDRVVGGDICSAEADGFMHGFEVDNVLLR